MEDTMKFNLWNHKGDVILSGDLCDMMNAALHFVNNGLMEFDNFEIINDKESYLPWETQEDIIYRITK